VGVRPSYLTAWENAMFDVDTPPLTALVVRVYYFDGASYVLVPDTDLPGNSAGFSTSPIDLTGLDHVAYPELQLGAFLTTGDASLTPVVNEWSIAYWAGPTPLPFVDFDIHGEKTIGTDVGGQPIYKFRDSFTTTQFAEWFLDPIEWDNYTVTLTDPESYDVVERCPAVVAPAPSQVLDVALTLGPDTPHSLRMFVVDQNNAPVTDALIRLEGGDNAEGRTSTCGQVYFGDLDSGIYTITALKDGFDIHSEEVGVLAETELFISLLPE
jgi:hypothetical protein